MKICVAGAGAGKTTAMAQKIANACNSLGPQQNIYCLSFTNAAVNHIKEKLSQYYTEVPPNIIVCTLHSFLYKEIIKPYYFLLYRKQYERVSPINLPVEVAYKNKKIKELEDRNIIHVSIIPQRAKWVIVKKSSDKKREKVVRMKILDAFSRYCGKIFIDEAQDIDDHILEIIEAFDAAGISIELVGDPKQDLRGYGSFQKLIEMHKADVTFISTCHRCPLKHLIISNTLVPSAEKQISQKTAGSIRVIFENNLNIQEFLAKNNFDLTYISSKNDRFETHSKESASIEFETLNHEVSEIVLEKNPYAHRTLIKSFSYCLSNKMTKDYAAGKKPAEIIKNYFGNGLSKKQYAKVISALQKPNKISGNLPTVDSIDGIKGQEGHNCLFILTTDLAPYLFGQKSAKNKTRNKLYVALTRSLDALTILVTLEVEQQYGVQYIRNYFTNLLTG